MTALLAVFAVSITHDTAASRSALTERFQSRADLTASFVTGYVDDLAAREVAQATRLLSATDVSDADFEQVVLGFGFAVAGLFDAQGRLLVIWPPSPELIGEPFADRYAHVATALDGDVGVSGVVASAATSSPVVAVAVPFETPSGRRVLSGAVRPDTGSLRTYFDTVIPLGGRTYLVDRKGNIVVTGKSGDLTKLPPMLTAGGLLRLSQTVGTYAVRGPIVRLRPRACRRNAVERHPHHPDHDLVRADRRCIACLMGSPRGVRSHRNRRPHPHVPTRASPRPRG